MFRFRQRQRKTLAAIVVGYWLFAFFVGVAHACGIDEVLGESHALAVTVTDSQGRDDDAAPGCHQFCADDLPMLAKLKTVQDAPTVQAFLVQALWVEPLLTGAAPIASLPHSPDPPPGIDINIRFVRLAL